jgi:TPR repeat protein
MKKPFAQCSLADFVHELHLAARPRDASVSRGGPRARGGDLCPSWMTDLSADIMEWITPCLLDHALTKAVLRRHPLVGGSSGLVRPFANDERAWRSMLRDLFHSAGVSVSDAAQLCVYLVVKQCAERGSVRLPHVAYAQEQWRLPGKERPSVRWCLQIFAAIEQLHGARVFMRVCNAQGAALVRIQLAPAEERLRLRTLVPVYEMAMGHRQRLRGMGCGGWGRLALLMSQGGAERGPVPRHCSALMDCIVRRVAAQVAAMPEVLLAQVRVFRATGDYAAAAALLQQAVGHGHVLSRAELADMLIFGREGVAKDHKRAFELVEEGARLGCHHSQGVLAQCYFFGYGCSKDAARSLALARASAGKGSKYGQRTLGDLYYSGAGGVAQDYAAAVAQYRLAAAQGYDVAQHSVGYMYNMGYGVAHDLAEALQWYKLAAAQGFSAALYNVGWYHENGWRVAANRAEAIRWYKRAAAAGYSKAADALKRLGA